MSKRAYGSGSISPRGDDTWLLSYYGQDGKRRWRTVHGGRKEAEKELRRLLKTIDDNVHIDRSKATIGDILDDYFTAQALTVSARTIEGEREKAKHVRDELGKLRAQTLDARNVEDFLAKLRKDGWQPASRRKDGELPPRRPHSVANLRKIRGVLYAALSLAKARGVVSRNVIEDVKLPKPDKTQREHAKEKSLTLDQRDALLAALAGTDGKHSASRWYDLARLAAATGARRGELLALRWSDIDLDGEWLQIQRVVSHTKDGGTVIEDRAKTKESLRKVAIDPDTVTFLRGMWAAAAEVQLKLGRKVGKGDLLFHPEPVEPAEPWNPEYVSSQVIKHCAARGFKGKGLHSFRHSYAGRMIEAGAPVTAIAAQLGHKSAKMTLDVYGKSSPEAQQSVAKLLGQTFKK